MFFAKSHNQYGLLVDVGSGSVGLSLCRTTKESQIEVLWTHREHTSLRHIESLEDSSKAIITALMNVVLLFESKGRTALSEIDPKGRISVMQATVAAPWAYTTTRTIKFEQDEPFEITEQMVTDLAQAAGQQAITEFSEQHSLESLGVKETSRCALDTYANGYRIAHPNKQKAKNVTVTHATTLVRTEIIDALQEINHKLFTNVPLQVTSFMLANYFATRDLLPHIYDVCLVDITNEATEIGIVRDGSLQYSTHTPFGRASLARELAEANGVPLQEAFARPPSAEELRTNKDVQAVMQAYTEKVQQLFHQTGDRLTIPKNIYLETSGALEEFFTKYIQIAAEQASKSNITITNVSLANKIESKHKASQEKHTDTALIIAAGFFHISETWGRFEYL